jgi:hypothetical protein
MPRQGGVQIVEDPRASHVGFADERFLGRTTVEDDCPVNLPSFDRFLQRDDRTDTGGTKEVVPTTVTWPARLNRILFSRHVL